MNVSLIQLVVYHFTYTPFCKRASSVFCQSTTLALIWNQKKKKKWKLFHNMNFNSMIKLKRPKKNVFSFYSSSVSSTDFMLISFQKCIVRYCWQIGKQMSDNVQLPFGAGKIKNSTSLPTTTASTTTSSNNDGLASHIRLSNIFAPLIDLNASGEQTTDYDSTTLHSLQSTMSSSSSSNPVSVSNGRKNEYESKSWNNYRKSDSEKQTF